MSVAGSSRARATQNSHFAELMATLGAQIIPRARLEPATDMSAERLAYMRRVNAEHESILDAIASQDAESARAAHSSQQQPRAPPQSPGGNRLSPTAL